jgi:hypothetical protein
MPGGRNQKKTLCSKQAAFIEMRERGAVVKSELGRHEDISGAVDSTANSYKKNHFFWKSGSPFSQWHLSGYKKLNRVAFCCAEQGMMHGKALLFGDQETADKILCTKSPRTMKQLGRQVRFFRDEE